ncbi:MAG: S1/P1 Nuclease [Rhizomicrobium sp.]|jgi:hypothetical protein
MSNNRPWCTCLFSSVAVTIALLPASASAWGSSGHRMTGELAIRNLPQFLPDFIRSDAVALDVGELAREPDRSRGAGVSHDPDLDPGHFVDVSDDGKILEGPPLSALPATREDYDSALRAAGTDQYKAGYLPYSIIDGWQQLVKDFAYWRVDVAEQKLAGTDDRRAWFARDQASRERLTIRDLGYWAHFVGDASQPMHVSVHYDGWGSFPNPNGYTTAHGVHAHFEGAYVRAHIAESDVQSALAGCATYSGTVQSQTAAYLGDSLAQVVPFYELEKAHAFDGGDPAGKSFAVQRLAAAVCRLRDMITDAWIASDDATVGFPALPVKDIEGGKVDAYASLYGED